MPRLLLVNPWIYDFSAYDFWLKPVGLLTLASALKTSGFEVSLLDLTDCGGTREPDQKIKRKPDGRSDFYAEEVPKPPALRKIPRRFKRYGLPLAAAKKLVKKIAKPDAILLGTTMTYWSYGYCETVQFLRGFFPDTPIIAGGLYATICNDHAQKNLGADYICAGNYEQNLTLILQELFGPVTQLPGPEHLRPALELYPSLEYGIELTGRGCPFRCRYCVGWKLNKSLKRKTVDRVVEEIEWQAKELRLSNIAFYDDALLIDPENHIMPILEAVVRLGLKLKFHTPNGLHLKPMNRELARLMKRAGFETIRFGLETADRSRQESLGFKAGEQDLNNAMDALESAGYERSQIGVYLLMGLPGQTPEEVEADIVAVKKTGARPFLAEFSPIPGTDLWEEAVAAARYPIAEDPLFHNCSLLPCGHPDFTPQKYSRLKQLCKQ
jgi:radical SAM superfamily enzyme YgiQ (UPF0313 family)